MSGIRQCCVRGRFYPHSGTECSEDLSEYTNPEGAVEVSGTPRAGIVPHAGWVFSGPTAGRVFASIKQSWTPGTFIILGAMHRRLNDIPAVFASGEWETPLGNIAVDSDVADAIVEAFEADVDTEPALHHQEHSIEVQVPFIKFLFPEAKIVPILMPPSPYAAELGSMIGNIASDNSDLFVVGSTDLTHYGPEYGFAPKGTGEAAHRWVKEENDRKIVDMMCGMKADEIVGEARNHHNACGSGAASATVAAAAGTGRTSGTLVEYTTSHDVMPRGEPSMFVGYAGIIF